MARGFGRGFGRGMGYGMGGGFGFGFRGSSPPWPYIGRGRGGLPRCGYFLGGTTAAPWAYWPQPMYAGYGPVNKSYPSTIAGEDGLDSLREQARLIKKELESIHSRIKDIETVAERQ